jgi:hypothetical protein
MKTLSTDTPIALEGGTTQEQMIKIIDIFTLISNTLTKMFTAC